MENDNKTVENDSGVDSLDVTPVETQPSSSTVETTKMTDNEVVKVSSKTEKPEAAAEDDLVIEDETVFERLFGLTEMFPESLQNVATSASSASVKILFGTYSTVCKLTWFASTVSLLLVAPVLFEVERINTEEQIKHDRNKLVLGPGVSMSGPPPSMTGVFGGPGPN